MNTRIQVEHTVTEMVTGLDLVREQIRVALGEPLSVTQEDVELRGHAIECRINAEDASKGFLPAPAPVTGYREPSGPGVRVDSGVAAGYEVSASYDPMIAKLIVHGVDREHARRRMLRALDEFWIEGPQTLVGFHKALLSHPCFVAGETCHGIVESLELPAQSTQFKSAPHRHQVPGQVSQVGSDGRAGADGRGRRAAVRGAAHGARARVAGAGGAASRARPRGAAPAARARTRSSPRCRAPSSP